MLLVGILCLIVGMLLLDQLGLPLERLDLSILRGFEAIRVGWLTRMARGVNGAAGPNVNLILRWGTIVVLIVYRRWRHLATFIGAILVLGWVGTVLPFAILRPRPLGITILAPWSGPSMPSQAMAALSGTLMGMGFCLIPDGRWRARWFWAADGIILVLGLARIYLGVDHPSDVLVGVILGMGIMVLAFRLFCPDEAFPVTYRRGRSAHLDVGGPRGEAIRTAMRDQLGLDVLEVKPFGLSGSGGSTPLRLSVSGEEGDEEGQHVHLFGKLYAATHLRNDRNYKAARTIWKGQLEDEKPFHSVRQLVQQEDYLLRVFRDAGVPAAKTYGFVEITPQREYMIVTEFLDGAREISEVPVDEEVVDSALHTVRQLWDAGLAHRDIKPANVLVRDGEALLIDVAFAEIRPSSWRQAVDLGNMLAVLGLYADPAMVYGRALRLFSEDEVSEALSAARGIASPSQLRTAMKDRQGNVMDELRAMAKPRPKVRVGRWSVRRIAVTLWVIFLVVIALFLVFGNLRGAGLV